MSDERKCFAGDLGTGQLGKRVTVSAKSGVVVTDTLRDVWHCTGGDGAVETWVRLVNVGPEERLTFREGFSLDPSSTVTVLS